MRLVVMRLLRESGYSNFTEAASGRHAYDLIVNGGKFDLIFCDHYMPELTGLDLLAKVRQLDGWKDTPFFLVSSESETGMIVEAIKRGATHYLIKPVNLDSLKNMMKVAFARIKAGNSEP